MQDTEGEPMRGPMAGLPPAVMRSIQNAPSYAEGQVIPWRDMSAYNAEYAARSQRRDQQISDELAQRNAIRQGGAISEGYYPGSAYSTSPIYPSPLNSMMRRAPLALY
jgi:hypothetical protein